MVGRFHKRRNVHVERHHHGYLRTGSGYSALTRWVGGLRRTPRAADRQVGALEPIDMRPRRPTRAYRRMAVAGVADAVSDPAG